MFKKIGLGKEIESPENPGAMEERVALTPDDVKKLVDYGVDANCPKMRRFANQTPAAAQRGRMEDITHQASDRNAKHRKDNHPPGV